MDLREIQIASSHWRHANFPGVDTGLECLMGMMEELGEITHHYLKRRQSIRGGEEVDHEAEIQDGCADLIIFMMGLADSEGFDLLDVLNTTWENVSQRDWITYPENGVTA